MITMTAEDDSIRYDRMSGSADRAAVRADYLDFINMVTIAPMSSRDEREARAFIGLTSDDLA